MSSATALPLKGTVQISHASTHTKAHTHLNYNHVSQVQKKKQTEKRRERESKKNVHHTDRKGEKSSHPHNLRSPLPPSTHPPPSLFPRLVINLPVFPALLSVLSFCAHANSEHIPFHFLALFHKARLFLILHCVSLGNKLAASTYIT